MWDKTYDTAEYVYGTAPNDFLKAHYQAISKGKVLLLAEGEGRNAVFLAQQGYDVTGVDISAVGLEKAQKLARENNVSIETVCADLATFDLGEMQWDGIVSIFCHLPPDLRRDLYQRVEKSLKSNGVFLLEGYRPEQLGNGTGGPSLAEMMISKDNLLSELPSLNFRHLETLNREIHEGTHHTGMGAVIQAIATKD